MSLGKALSDAVAGLIALIAIVCICIGGLVVWGLPKLWELVKPWIHALTA